MEIICNSNSRECITTVSSRQKILSYVSMDVTKSLDFSSQKVLLLTAVISPETIVSLLCVSFLNFPRSNNVAWIKYFY